MSKASRKHHEADRFLLWGLILLLIWSPIPWGSIEPWSRCVLCVTTGLLASCWALLYAFGIARLTSSFRAAYPVLLIWATWVLYTLLQALAPILLTNETPAYALYQFAASTGLNISAVVSIEPHATLVAAALSFALMMTFSLLLLLIRSPERLQLLAYALLVSGVIQAIYGLVMSLSGLEYGFFAKKTVSLGLATGTYINRNHYAGYLEMCLAVGIGLLLGGNRTQQYLTNWQDWLRAIGRFLLSEKAPLRIAILIMALALIMSRSRMGNSAFLASLTLIGLLYVLKARGTFRTRMIILWISIMVVDISFLGSYFGLEQLKQRLETTTTWEMDSRVDISNHLQPYVSDYQPVGSGLGTFQEAFMRYLGPDMQFIYQGAENDYLQFMGEAGVMAAIPAMLVMGTIIVALRVVRSGGYMIYKGMSFAAVMGVFSMLIHSLVDFNLQIPANANLFVVLLAIGWISRYQSPTTSDNYRNDADRIDGKIQ